jgi:hypothetical protein
MVPGPLFASPPVTDQVTSALPPPVSVAVNCSTEEPRELVVLQPVQLVSMALAPGLIAKASLEGAAVTPPIPAAGDGEHQKRKKKRGKAEGESILHARAPERTDPLRRAAQGTMGDLGAMLQNSLTFLHSIKTIHSL